MREQQNEEAEEIVEQIDFTKPDFVFLPQGSHTYRQHGPYLVCKSCEIQHAIWIGIDKVMVGVGQTGEPIIKKRSELGL